MRRPEDIIINNKTLEQILIEHKHWIYKDCDGWENMKANLHYADLYNADLRNINLQGADLFYANLQGADLCYANLQSADLSYAVLRDASLCFANLCAANLYAAKLQNINLSFANLRGANLYYTNLYSSNLYYADLCNVDGNLIKYRKGKMLSEDIIGYKKCKDNVIVTLKIPRGAIIFSINGYKCRTNKAKVVSIDGADRAFSSYNNMSYYVGDEITIYDFNCEYNIECAKGVHFFMTREEAEHYIF